jgi:hypothetical protein
MSFKSIKNWMNEIDGNLAMGNPYTDMSNEESDYWADLHADLEEQGLIVLFPGGFKPMTGGHLDLIRRYDEDPVVKEVRVLVGPGVRNGIDQDTAVKVAEKLTENMPKVKVEGVKWPSPVLTSYKIIEEATEPGIYTLAASSKGGDDERITRFVQQHQQGGKFCREKDGIRVIDFPVNVEPALFNGRNDEHEGEPISASVLRNDIINDDLENFTTGYPDSSPDEIDFVWDSIGGVVMSEAAMGKIHLGQGTTQSTMRNYDRSQPGNWYKNLHMVADLTEEEEDDQDRINEGGGAGHMMSPWEVTDMTFGDIRQFIFDAMSGKLENVTEKLDGQNIMATFKDGNVYLARSPKHMKNGGEQAIRWDDVWDNMYEKTPDHVKEAYTDALTDLQAVFTNSDLDWDKLFKDGHRWLNIELLNPKMENIVPYGDLQLRIHNIREVDDNAKEVDVIWDGELMDEVIKAIDTEDTGRIHTIKKTNTVNFEKIDDLENIQEGIIRKMQTFMDKYHLDDENTIDDYLAERVKEWVETHIDDPELVNDLVQRWGYGNKSKNITATLKGKDKNDQEWVRAQDKKIDDVIGRFLDPIIEIFTRVGTAVLKSVSGIAASSPEESAKGIQKKAQEAMEKIKQFMASNPKDIDDFEKKMTYLETQLRRLEQHGGLESVVPMEGIVFEYKGQLFKLTGNYLPILKMVNFFRFGKDKK